MKCLCDGTNENDLGTRRSVVWKKKVIGGGGGMADGGQAVKKLFPFLAGEG